MTAKDWVELLIPILCNVILVCGAGAYLKSYIEKQSRKNEKTIENSVIVMNELLSHLESIQKLAIDIEVDPHNQLEKQLQNMYILGGDLQIYIENHKLYLANHQKNVFLYDDLVKLLETFKNMGHSQTNNPDKFALYFKELQKQCTHIINGYNKYISEN